MIILLFGAYDKNYSRNKINIAGLKANDVKVIECHITKPTFKSESKVTIIRYLVFLPFAFLYRNFALIYKSYLIFQRNKFDSILVAYPGQLDLPAAFFVKNITGKKVYFDSIDSIYDTFVVDRKIITNKFLSNILFNFEKILYKIPDTILVDTDSNGKFLTKLFKTPAEKIKTLYIGAENKLYKKTKKQENKNFIVTFYGQASPLHGIEYIIRAAEICQKTDKKIKFVLLGDGQTRKRDIELSQELGLKNITFLPSMIESKAAKIVSNTDIFLGVFKGNPKSLRVIPNKVYQGIAMAKPIITQDSEAIREIFKNKENIYLCKPADEKSLAKRILHLKKNPKKKEEIAKNGYKLYLSKFTPDKIGQDFIKILGT